MKPQRARTRVVCALVAVTCGCAPGAQAPRQQPTASAPTPANPCVSAEPLRSRATLLLSQGKLDRALRTLRKADQLCPSTASSTWEARITTAALLGAQEEVRAVATLIGRSAEASTSARRAAQEALATLDQPAANGEQLLAQAIAMDPAATAPRQRLLDRAAAFLERAAGARRQVAFPQQVDVFQSSPDGQYFAIAVGGQLCLHDRKPWRLRGCVPGFDHLVRLRFSPDSTKVLGLGLVSPAEHHGSEWMYGVWDASSGRRVGSFPLAGFGQSQETVDGSLRWFAWSERAQQGRKSVLHLLDIAAGTTRDLTAGPSSPSGSAAEPLSAPLTADGRVLITNWATSLEGTETSLRLFETASARQVGQLRALARRPDYLHFNYEVSGDSSLLAYVKAQRSTQVGLFDLRRNIELPPLECGKVLHSVRLSAEGRRLAAVGGPGTSGNVWLWDVPSRRLLRTIALWRYPSSELWLSPTGGFLYNAGDNTLYRASDGKAVRQNLEECRRNPEEHGDTCAKPTCTGGRGDCTCSPADRIHYFCTSSQEPQTRLVIVGPGDNLSEILLPDRFETWALSPGGSRAGGSLGNAGAGVVDLHSGALHLLEHSDRAWHRSLVFLDSDTLAGPVGASVWVWDAATGRRIWLAAAGQEGVSSAFAGADRSLTFGGDWLLRWEPGTNLPRTLAEVSAQRLWHTGGGLAYWVEDTTPQAIHLVGVESRDYKIADGTKPSFSGISPEGTLLATFEGSPIVSHIYDLGTGFRLPRFEPDKLPYLNQVVFSRNGRVFAGNGIEERSFPVSAWDVASGRRLHASESPNPDRSAGVTLALSDDGGLLAIASYPEERDASTTQPHYKIEVWDLSTNSKRFGLKLPQFPSSLAFNPDSSLIAVLDYFGQLRWLRASDGGLVRTVPTPLRGSLSFSADGRLVLVTGERVSLFRVADGRHVADLRVLGGPEGLALAAQASDGRVEFLGGADPARAAVACKIGDKTFPYELCKERLEYPVLLRTLLSGELDEEP